MTRVTAAALALILTGSFSLHGQVDNVRFEEASVRPNDTVGPIGGLRPTPGRFAAIGMPLRNLITYAHQVNSFQLVDAPSWVDTTRYDINAVMPAGVRGQDRAMLRTLLVERFGLKTRRETREMPIYHLVRSRPDGALGPSLRPTPDGTEQARCTAAVRPGLIDARCREWSTFRLANQLGLDRLVVDKTDLSGRFDIRLEWSAQDTVPTSPALGDTVNVFTALQEQLGLRVQNASGPVDVLVIESVVRPMPD